LKKYHNEAGKAKPNYHKEQPVDFQDISNQSTDNIRRKEERREQRYQDRINRQIVSSLGGETQKRSERQAAITAEEAEKSALIRELLENAEPMTVEKLNPHKNITDMTETADTAEPSLSLETTETVVPLSLPRQSETNVSEDMLQVANTDDTPKSLGAEEIAELSNILNPISFTESLEKLTPDTIAPLPEKENVPFADRIREFLRKLMLFGCLCVFGYSVFMLAQNIIDKQRGQDIYGDISSSIFESDLTTHAVSLMSQSRSSVGLPDYYTALNADADELAEYAEPKAYNQTFERMKSNIAALTAQNSDTFGYIRIDGTNISYPIMQSSDNEYYLDHAYTGDPLIIGAIFADFRAYRYMDWNYNTVFYGHNIIDGSMFNNVTLFFDKEVFDSKLIEIYTPDAIYYYKPFAIFQAQATYQYFEMYFATGEDFVNFCYEMQERSTINNHETFTEDDRIITLSTCVNDPAGLYRYALQAKLVKIEN